MSNPSTARPRSSFPGTDSPIDFTERMPPHDLSAEAGVLGSMIIDPQTIASSCAILRTPDAFFREENQIIFRVISELFQAHKPVDGMILHSTLKTKNLLDQVGGIDYIKELATAVPVSANSGHYAAIVKEKAEVRLVISACSATLRDCYESGGTSAEIIDRWGARYFSVAQQQNTSAVETRLVDDLHNVFEALDRRQAGQVGGLTTGFRELDNLIDGLHPAEMIVVAARPSVGKSAFASCIAEHVGVDRQIPVGFLSMEMPKLSLVQRMLCSRSGVDAQRLRRNTMTRDDRTRLTSAVGELSSAPIFLDDTPGLNLMDVRTKARRMVEHHGIQLLIVDYLQLMEPMAGGRKGENRTQEISTISRGVKALSRDLNIPIVALSQLNRASENENRLPRTSDLRESGSIEQDADVVLLLHREAVMHRGDDQWADANRDKLNEALVIVAKQRNGPPGAFKLTFRGESTRFMNYVPGA